MTDTPDVLIIGAGVVGASVAWHLAEAGVKRILLIDRTAAPGSGSTARATGGFRAQFGSEINVRLSLLSREKLLRFREDTGTDPGYVQAGYLFVAADGDVLSALNAARETQIRAGFDETVVLDASQLLRINPHLRPDTYIGGTFSPGDGFIRPAAIASGYLESARRRGAELRCQTANAAIETDRSRVTAVRTSDGQRIAPGCVVNAGGAWAAAIARSAGILLDVSPLRRQVASTVPTDRIPPSMPMTIYADDGYHLRERDGRALLLWPDDPRDPESDTFDDSWLDEVERKTRKRVASLDGVPIDRAHCWSGLYEMSPDHHAILGRSQELENFILANGSSGHGVMHAPALGQLVAELITDGEASSIDIHSLRPSRFSEGDPIEGTSLL